MFLITIFIRLLIIRLTDRTGSFFFRAMILFLSRAFLFVCGFRLVGAINLPKTISTSKIFVANHQSLIDAIVLVQLLGPLSFVVKEEIRNQFLIGFVLEKVLDCIFVKQKERPTQQGAKVCSTLISSRLLEINRQETSKYPPRNPLLPLVIFPEGTTTNGLYLIQFFSGAFLGSPVIPVCIVYKSKRSGLLSFVSLPPFTTNKRMQNSGSTAWESIPLFYHFWIVLTQPSVEYTVTFLAPCFPTKCEKASPPLFASNVREKMAACLGVPLIDASLHKKREYHQMILDGHISWFEVAQSYHSQ